MRTLIYLTFILFSITKLTFSQPQSGNILREYSRTISKLNDNEVFLCIGKEMDYRLKPQKFPKAFLHERYIQFSFETDLKNAYKAEIILEKARFHEGTKELRLSINHHGLQSISFTVNAPLLKEFYFHHNYFNVKRPLQQLKDKGHGLYV